MLGVCQVPLINGAFHNQFAVFVAIDARPQSLIAGNLITSFVSNTPALTYSFQPQPLVVRPSADDTVVVNSKPTVVYKTPKRIIYRKITCYRYVMCSLPFLYRAGRPVIRWFRRYEFG